jgi:hypothetical protein
VANELSTTSSNELAKQHQAQVAKRVSDLERGGYYKNVVSPEDYLARKQKSGNADTDLELQDDAELNSDVGSRRTENEVVPLKHWNTNIQKKFDECTDSQKKAWLDSFKIIEKGYVKQLNALKDDLNVAGPVLDALEPYLKGINNLGMTAQEYLKELLAFDDKLGLNPAYYIAKLIAIHNITYNDIYNNLNAAIEEVATENKLDKYITPLKQEITQLKSGLGLGQSLEGQSQESPAVVKEAADEIVDKVTMFFEQKDASGRDLYPGAFEHMEDILELVQMGETLDDAYNYVINGKSAQDDRSSDDRGSEVEYDEPRAANNQKLTSAEKEKQMLRNALRKIERR